jgi:transcription elongation factor Elf1
MNKHITDINNLMTKVALYSDLKDLYKKVIPPLEHM